MKKTVLIALILTLNMCNGGNLFSSGLSDVEEVWCKSALSAVRGDRLWIQLSSGSVTSDPISYDGYYLKDRFLSKSLSESMKKISGFDDLEISKLSFGIPEDEPNDYLFLFSTSDNEVVQENRISLCKLWYQVNLNN